MITEAVSRSCGDCTACCKALGVKEIKKPPGEWCGHCNRSKGCRIYSTRPKACKQFQCAWLKGYGDDKDRPDRSRVILDPIHRHDFGQTLQVWYLDKKELSPEEAILNLGIKDALLQSWVVLAVTPRNQETLLLLPPGKKLPENITPHKSVRVFHIGTVPT